MSLTAANNLTMLVVREHLITEDIKKMENEIPKQLNTKYAFYRKSVFTFGLAY